MKVFSSSHRPNVHELPSPPAPGVPTPRSLAEPGGGLPTPRVPMDEALQRIFDAYRGQVGLARRLVE